MLMKGNEQKKIFFSRRERDNRKNVLIFCRLFFERYKDREEGRGGEGVRQKEIERGHVLMQIICSIAR